MIVEQRPSKPLVVLAPVVVLGGAVGYLALRSGGESSKPAQERPAAAFEREGAERVSGPSLGLSAPAAGAAGTARKGPPKLDRAQRDEVRKSVYQRLGQPVPTQDVRSKPLPPSPVVLDKDYVQSRIRSDFIPLALQCYASLLTTQPDARGKAVVSFVIVGDQSIGGIVESADLVDGTTLDDPEFVTCLRESLLSVVFDPPAQGGWVTVTYPFEFSPDEPE